MSEVNCLEKKKDKRTEKREEGEGEGEEEQRGCRGESDMGRDLGQI